MEVQKIANSPLMWVVCGIPVMFVLAQAVIFAVKSYQTGKELGMEEEKLKQAIKSSVITAIGPSVVILSGMLSILVILGGPVSWMRLSTIGSVMFESIAAGIGTSAVGVTLGVDELTETAFAMALWTMILGSVGWVLFATFSADKMDKVQKKLSKGNARVMNVIASAAIIGVFSALSASHLVKLDKHALACVLGGVIMLLLSTVAERFQLKWLKEWALTITIISSMVITALV